MPRYMIRDKKITIELKKKQIVIKEEIIILLIITGFIIPYFIQIIDLSRRSRLWPTFIVITISILMLIKLIQSISIIKTTVNTNSQQEADNKKTERSLSLKERFTLFPLLALIILAVALPVLGTYIAVPIFVFFTMLYYGVRKWAIMILVVLGVTLFLFFVFKMWLMVPLPEGIIFRMGSEY